MPELIGPPVIYTNPYTGLPTVKHGKSKSNYYPHQTSPHVSWGYKKNNNILWVESEWNLEGTCSIVPNLQMVAAKLVTMKGIGQSLSGDWWISSVTHTIDVGNNGYTMELNLMRNAIGDTPKKKKTPAQQNKTRKPKTRSTTKRTSQKSYKVRSGDSLWIIARRFYGSGSLYPKIKAANPALKNTNDLYVGQELIIP